MFWIALAAQVAAPNTPPPQHVQGLISYEDYPPAALDRGEQGAVYFQVVINPEGRVDRCTVLGSSGHQDLDDATCRLVILRARFSPAHDDDGKPIYGTYRQIIAWSINSYRPPAPIPPNLDLTINQAPSGAKLPLQFTVQYQVKANATVSHCHVTSNAKPAPQVLVDLACETLTQSPLQVVRNRNNEPVDACDSATVRFSVKP